MLDMAIHQILPAASAYTKELCDAAAAKQAMGVPCCSERDLIVRLAQTQDDMYSRIQQLTDELKTIPADAKEAAQYCRQVVIASMNALRASADRLEELTAKKYWPFPTYSDLLFY